MRYVSLFSGALGLDLGLESEGWECLATNELDPLACQTIRLNRPQLRLIEGDIRGISADALRGETGPVDAVVGGPPCQSFSTAGKRRSVEDARGSLLEVYAGLAIGLEPRFIVLENVRGLLSAPLRHRPHSQRGAGHPELRTDELPGGVLRNLVRQFVAAGYTCSFSLYDAACFGAAQRRERVVLVACREGRVPHLPSTTLPGSFSCFRDVSAGLSQADCLPLRPAQERFLGLVPEGGNWRSLPSVLQPEALGGAYQAGGGRVGFLRRLAWDSPSPTLVTDPTMPATLLAHPSELRALSIQEYKRIQGFPDGWRLSGALKAQYRQVGNAVPIPLGRAVARHLDDFAAGRCRLGVGSTSRYRGTTEAELLAG